VSTRQAEACATILLLLSFSASAATLRIGVFTLFHPLEIRIAPVSAPIRITTDDRQIMLEGNRSYTIRLASLSTAVRVTSRDGADADFRLSIPGKIQREFHGVLTVKPGDHKLIAIVAMDSEIAVASVVAAELSPATPLEAIKAQAVAARSYYAASAPRHDDFAFCDTTHCQFLREPPAPTSKAFRAAQDTRNLVLAYQGKPFPALYSAACGGQTRTLEDPASGYQYQSVSCDVCRRRSPGVVKGHQLGLCQTGAAGMAEAGSDFRAILDHYFPAASIVQISPIAIFFVATRAGFAAY
jgi:peptidoglycan hydrolase-like amidase